MYPLPYFEIYAKKMIINPNIGFDKPKGWFGNAKLMIIKSNLTDSSCISKCCL